MAARTQTPIPEKLCPACGRRFGWRSKWARNWDRVRFCSARCRNRPRSGTTDRALEAAILDLLSRRSATATICPSEAVRLVRPDDWRDWMEATRAAARRLVARGLLEITQRGRVVDPSTARGALRLRRPRRSTTEPGRAEERRR